MSKSILSSLSVAALAGGAMLALELSPASAFTLSGPSLQPVTSGQFDKVYYRADAAVIAAIAAVTHIAVATVITVATATIPMATATIPMAMAAALSLAMSCTPPISRPVTFSGCGTIRDLQRQRVASLPWFMWHVCATDGGPPRRMGAVPVRPALPVPLLDWPLWPSPLQLAAAQQEAFATRRD